ncbi:endonuclease/exonuclease/phosphatase family protein [Pseudomonas fulva]|uniref:endonuclease/exonuclease/phosphatase family protein n=1 Tax=Pseudomonas TaxID=286 RepID=UPI0015E3EAA6|nr:MULTISPECIES: endonuclease/exonuclease/phosphatase family protein [Pseudomonas]EKT4493082.1 endonuclease/exonuclease/phosphatase family protein [Pseudomonas putida]EKT8864122.1 endonuclease/exonuclease/phosphatase family protein [Pseudomonas putida]MBA1223752.1 endonuclease/exonuclease/phosphatase family protein [Pseudomonas fulva]
MKLTVLTYNTLFAGRDGTDSRRATDQIALINAVKPDVFLMQEAKHFEQNGAALLFELEAKIGMRGFLAKAPVTGQNVAIFIRLPIQAIRFEVDAEHFHHALATLTVSIPGVSQPLTLMSAHLSPNGRIIRQREAAYLALYAQPDKYIVLAGDFNSASPRDPQPLDFRELAAHHRTRYLADDLQNIDHSVVAGLEAAGWHDIGYRLKQQTVPTVPTAAFTQSEFPTMRCDYVWTSRALAEKAVTYEVIRTTSTDTASDHYPIVCTFEI